MWGLCVGEVADGSVLDVHNCTPMVSPARRPTVGETAD